MLCFDVEENNTEFYKLSQTDLSAVNEDITYQILMSNFHEDLADIKKDQNGIVKLKNIKKYINDLTDCFQLQLCNRSIVVRELYLLHQTAKALEKYNSKMLNYSHIKFRSLVYFPNIVYVLIRFFPNAKKFIQQNIRKVYQEYNNKATGLINTHINSFYIDQDVIKSDILYSFLGNGLKKYDPLHIGNIKNFYKSCMRSIFNFYFKEKRELENQDLVDFCFFDMAINKQTSSNRLSLYKDVLYELHIKQTQKKHCVLNQLSYNFQIFRNIIISNEFQNIYQQAKLNEGYAINNEYKLIDFFDDDIFSSQQDLLEELRKLPLIYKLLRCVHVQSTNTLPYNDFLIKPDVLRMVIIEELSASFKNLFIDQYISDILNQIAKNFIKNVLTGEYINLITFSTVKINHLSFLEQLRKFIRLCLGTRSQNVC